MGDTNMCTDNPVLIRHSHNPPSILCVQRKAEKKIPSEEDIVQANKLAFNGDIGIVTNHVTSMIERRAGFDEGSEEYKALDYRIKCGQNMQQNVIDRSKGIIAKSMPSYWYSVRDNFIKEEDTEEEKLKKEFNSRIVAPNKPYFMIYVYPQLKRKYKEYIRNSNQNAVRKFRRYKAKNVSGLYALKSEDPEVLEFIRHYEQMMPVGNNPCVVNRICWFVEKAFKGVREKRVKTDAFDYSILKSGVQYSKNDYQQIESLYKEYNIRMETYFRSIETKRPDRDFEWLARHKFADTFKADCEKICPNEDELCDIVLDLCYKSDRTKQFAWDICGDTIIRNLLTNSDNAIWYPKRVEKDGEFMYCGEQFIMCEKVITETNDLTE